MLIKSIRKFLMNAYVGISLLFVFAISASTTFANRPMVKKISGEEIFKGLFFLEGEYSEMIPQLASLKDAYSVQNMTLQQKHDLEVEKGRIINYIKEKDADFFTNLVNTIKTGNRIEVKSSLEAATLLLKEATGEKSNNTEATTIATDQGTEMVVVLCALLPYATSIHMSWYNIVVYWDETSGLDTKSSLFKEQIINSVCETSSAFV